MKPTRRELLRSAILGGSLALGGVMAPLALPALVWARPNACLPEGDDWRCQPASPAGFLAQVAVGYDSTATAYPAEPPFDPEEAYPELPLPPRGDGRPNAAYRLVRDTLRAWQPRGFGSPDWSPLADTILPGDTVVLKPNLVFDGPPGTLTHASVIRAALDYAYKACGPRGRLLVAEGPAAAADFDAVVAKSGVGRTVQMLRARGMPVELVDLNRTAQAETPIVDLGQRSLLAEVDRQWFNLRDGRPRAFGELGIGRYALHPVLLQANVFVSLPRLKVHRAAGITVAMKNLLGLVPAWEQGGTKGFPHYSSWELAQGDSAIYLQNDTLWRVMGDLQRAVLFADAAGTLRAERQRRYLAIVDGLQAGGQDMFAPQVLPWGMVLVGDQPVSTDAVAARAMGFDPHRVATVVRNASAAPNGLGPAVPELIDLRFASPRGFGPPRVVPPDTGTQSWVGRIEATAFDPPALYGIAFDTPTRSLHTRTSSATEVRAVWLAIEHGDHSDVLPLSPRDRSGPERVWELTGVPPASTAELVAVDALFNTARVAVRLS